MSIKRRMQIEECLKTLSELGVGAEHKAPHYVALALECLRAGEYLLAAKVIHAMPAKSAAHAIRAYCEGG